MRPIDESFRQAGRVPAGSAASEQTRRTYELDEDEIFRLGRACLARKEDGDFPEADKLAWRILHRLGVHSPPEIAEINLHDLINSVSPRARGPLSTMFSQVAHSLAFHGRNLEAFWFAERAAGLYSGDLDAYRITMQLALGEVTHKKGKAGLTYPVDAKEAVRQLLVGIDCTERMLKYRFGIVVNYSSLGPDLTRAAPQDAKLFLEAIRWSSLCGEKSIAQGNLAKTENTQLIGCAERTLNIGRILFTSVDIPSDPIEAAEQEFLGVSVSQENAKVTLKTLREVYRIQSALFLFLGDSQRQTAAQKLEGVFSEVVK